MARTVRPGDATGRRARGCPRWLVLAGALAPLACGDAAQDRALRPAGVVLFVADDMSWDTPGCYGGALADVTPNVDRLAAEGLRFEHAFVTVSVCRPSRMALLTGRLPWDSGGEGFEELRRPGVPHLPAILRESGYRVGVLGKLKDSTAYRDFEWDLAVGRRALGMGRSPRRFAAETRAFIEEARAARRPFFLMVNSHDPHRPLFGMEDGELYDAEVPAELPSRTFPPPACPVPGFLPELPIVRREVAAYFASARRCDDTLGAVLGVLDELGLDGEVLVVFLSDNGMPFPFAKATCYPTGTRVPWILRWPGRVAPGAVGEELALGIDLVPTLLDAVGVATPAGIHGRSLLTPDGAAGRPAGAFVTYDESVAGAWYPMRGVHDPDFAYVCNLWSNGERRFERPEQQTSATFMALEQAARGDAALARRFEFLERRAVEELYDLRRDPDCRVNLAADGAHAAALERKRTELEAWMEATGDPALETFRARESRAARDAFVEGCAERAGR